MKVQKNFQPAGEKKRKRASQAAEKTKSRFSFSEIFFLFREKKRGTRNKHSKKAKNAKKAKIVEAIKNRGRLAEREADPYDQVILGKG